MRSAAPGQVLFPHVVVGVLGTFVLAQPAGILESFVDSLLEACSPLSPVLQKGRQDPPGDKRACLEKLLALPTLFASRTSRKQTPGATLDGAPDVGGPVHDSWRVEKTTIQALAESTGTCVQVTVWSKNRKGDKNCEGDKNCVYVSG